MSIDPHERLEKEAEGLLEPIDELLARQEGELREAEERTHQVEQKSKKEFPPARRIDEK